MGQSKEKWPSPALPALLVANLARTLSRVADSRFREVGLSIGQMPVLAALRDGTKLSQRELAIRAGVEQPSMAQLLFRMERDGLIKREPDPEDGRSSLISLSDHALSLVEPVRAIISKGNSEAIVGFTSSEVHALTEMLLRMMENVGENAPESPIQREVKKRRRRRRAEPIAA